MGFKVGKGTNIRFAVIGIHHANGVDRVFPDNRTDSSGFVLNVTTDEEGMRRAGNVLLEAQGVIPGNSVGYTDIICPIKKSDAETDISIHPVFSFIHHHDKGLGGSVWKVSTVKAFAQIIGKEGAMMETNFNLALDPNMKLNQNDFFAGRCVYNNSHSDEMVIR